MPKFSRRLSQQRRGAVDLLPPNTPWWGVIVARVLTQLAWGTAIAAGASAYRSQPPVIQCPAAWTARWWPWSRRNLPEIMEYRVEQFEEPLRERLAVLRGQSVTTAVTASVPPGTEAA
jgi:hypothetical protein